MTERGEEKEITARRILHVFSPIFLVYYLIPDDCWIGAPKRIALLVILLAVLFSEFLRILFSLDLFELKSHERARISAYAWASLGFALAFLFFDPVFVVPVVFGMAWIDPLCGYMRNKRKGYPAIPLTAYALIMLPCLLILANPAIPKALLLALAGTLVAIGSEYPRLRHIDDDFMMVFLPLIAMTLVDYLL